MNKQAMKQQAIDHIDQMADELIKISLFLHTHPELGCEEFQAAGLLIDLAAQQGFTVNKNISGYPTAFTATKGSQGPKIGFLAEYDALPALGHACGHNLIAAMSWGAATAFASVASKEAVSCLIGCPAEETVGAKVAMAEDGIFDDLSAALIVHPADNNYAGGTSYATHPLKVIFHGRSSHVASQTDRGVNALDALITFYQGIKKLKQTFTEPVILEGIITQGGTAPNIIPDLAEAKFTIRALSSDYLENTVLPEVRILAHQVALETGTTVETVHYEPLFKELINDPYLLSLYRENMALLGEKVILLPEDSADGSTDVGNVSHVVPTLHPDLGIGAEHVAHTPEFALSAGSHYAQQRLLVGAKAMVMTAIDLI